MFENYLEIMKYLYIDAPHQQILSLIIEKELMKPTELINLKSIHRDNDFWLYTFYGSDEINKLTIPDNMNTEDKNKIFEAMEFVKDLNKSKNINVSVTNDFIKYLSKANPMYEHMKKYLDI